MKDIKVEAAESEVRIRALAVAAGLMTEQQAEAWIVVRAGEFGKEHFKDVTLPQTCPGCGHDHTVDGWLPLEIGISQHMPESTRNALFNLIDHSGQVN